MSEPHSHTNTASRGLMAGFWVQIWNRTARLDPTGIHASGGPVRTPLALELCPRCIEFFRVVDRVNKSDEEVSHGK